MFAELARSLNCGGVVGAFPGFGVLPARVDGLVEVQEETFAAVEEASSDDVVPLEGDYGQEQDVPREGEWVVAGSAFVEEDFGA